MSDVERKPLPTPPSEPRAPRPESL